MYDNYSATLFGVILRIVQNEEIAEEVLKNTFVKIWNNISQYNPTKDRFSAWLIGVARNTAFSKLHSNKDLNRGQYSSVDELLRQADSIMNSGLEPDIKHLKELISKMDIEYRQILYLLYFAGFSQAEVALKLNIPLGTVKTRSRMAVLKLRDYSEKLPE